MIKNTFVQGKSTLSYQDQGQGEVILLGHSYLYDSAMWCDISKVLSQTHRCIAIDFWAHGDSSIVPSATANLQDYAKHVLALMDELKIEQFAIVGSSLGGCWACELAVLAPERVSSLALINTFVGFEPQVMHKKYFAMLEAMQHQQTLPDWFFDTFVPMYFSAQDSSMQQELMAQLITRMQGLTSEQIVALAQVGRMLFGRGELIEQIEQLALPVLIVAGQDDKIRTPLEGYLMQDSFTGSKLEIIPRAGNMSVLEQPQALQTALVNFFHA